MFLNHITYISAERQWQGFERGRSQLSNGKKKKSDKTDTVCRQKIMLTWKVALVLLVFALFLTELSPHSSSPASHLKRKWLMHEQVYFRHPPPTRPHVLFTIFCSSSQHLSGGLFGWVFFLVFFLIPLPKIAGLRVPGTWTPVLVQTAGERKSPPCPSRNPSSKLKTFPSFICWLTLESRLCGACQLSWMKCSAFGYELLPTNDWAKPVHSFSEEFKRGSRSEEPCALLTKLSSSVHRLNYAKERTLHF